jgi:hypothetical protein
MNWGKFRSDVLDAMMYFILPIVVSATILFLTSCSTSLPSRPDTGNHGQGHSPDSDCQGQYAQYVQTPDGDRFFLECWGVNHGK